MAFFFQVESEGQKAPYMVVLPQAGDKIQRPSCSCPAAFFKKALCKHVESVYYTRTPWFPVEISHSTDPERPTLVRASIFRDGRFKMWRRDQERDRCRRAGKPVPPPLDPSGQEIL